MCGTAPLGYGCAGDFCLGRAALSFSPMVWLGFPCTALFEVQATSSSRRAGVGGVELLQSDLSRYALFPPMMECFVCVAKVLLDGKNEWTVAVWTCPTKNADKILHVSVFQPALCFGVHTYSSRPGTELMTMHTYHATGVQLM